MKEITKVENTDKLTVIDCYAEWCNPCKMLMPFVEQLSLEYENVNIVKANIDKSPEIVEKYSIMTVPTILFIKNGEMLDFLVGLTTQDAIKEKIKKYE